MMENLENKCVWKLSKISINKCKICEGYNNNCKDYLTYQQSKTVENLVDKYEKLVKGGN